MDEQKSLMKKTFARPQQPFYLTILLCVNWRYIRLNLNSLHFENNMSKKSPQIRINSTNILNKSKFKQNFNIQLKLI